MLESPRLAPEEVSAMPWLVCHPHETGYEAEPQAKAHLNFGHAGEGLALDHFERLDELPEGYVARPLGQSRWMKGKARRPQTKPPEEKEGRTSDMEDETKRPGAEPEDEPEEKEKPEPRRAAPRAPAEDPEYDGDTLRLKRMLEIFSVRSDDLKRILRIFQNVERTRSDPYALFLGREYGASVAVVEATAYPELTICEQR